MGMLTQLLANEGYYAYFISSVVLFICLFIAAIVSIVLVMLQQSNSEGIQGITGSSETFFGKNKGRSLESKFKKWTWICLIVLTVLSIVAFVIGQVAFSLLG